MALSLVSSFRALLSEPHAFPFGRNCHCDGIRPHLLPSPLSASRLRGRVFFQGIPCGSLRVTPWGGCIPFPWDVITSSHLHRPLVLPPRYSKVVRAEKVAHPGHFDGFAKVARICKVLALGPMLVASEVGFRLCRTLRRPEPAVLSKVGNVCHQMCLSIWLETSSVSQP